jgi:hypothetical protein
MTRPGSRRAIALAVVVVLFAAPVAAAPDGQLTWGVHINGHGPRVQESGLGLIPGHAYSAPYEDVRIKK